MDTQDGRLMEDNDDNKSHTATWPTSNPIELEDVEWAVNHFTQLWFNCRSHPEKGEERIRSSKTGDLKTTCDPKISWNKLIFACFGHVLWIFFTLQEVATKLPTLLLFSVYIQKTPPPPPSSLTEADLVEANQIKLYVRNTCYSSLIITKWQRNGSSSSELFRNVLKPLFFFHMSYNVGAFKGTVWHFGKCFSAFLPSWKKISILLSYLYVTWSFVWTEQKT